jgi:membrane associated rhomboid family serine protease
MIIIPTEKRFDWKHTPVMLFFIVLINVLVFFFYQAGDDKKFYAAINTYQQHQFLKLEWPAFKTYLSSKGETEELAGYQELYDNHFHENLIVSLLLDEGFYGYLKENPQYFPSHNDFENNDLEDWSTTRQRINTKIQSVSYIKLGLIPNQIKPLTLLTHQFLHGDVMHLLGNLFFLIICGFAVEAAVGHLRFLCFYLISGFAGGLLFAFMDLNNTSPLIGASGAISGVMAMYLGIFRLKKIKFFYWFFLFVGYFRAPALLLLPFYVGKELYSFYFDTYSNVAFMAHTGGFISGAILLAVTVLINPKLLNQEYIEEDQNIDPFQEELNKVYSSIDNYSFDAALTTLQAIIMEKGLTFDLAILRCQLLKISPSSDYDKFHIELFKINPPTNLDISKLKAIWQTNPQQQSLLDEDSTITLGMIFSTVDHLDTAEEIFNRLHSNTNESQSLGVLARKISMIYGKLKNDAKKQKYEKFADALPMGNI